MKAPRERNAPVEHQRIERWLDEFARYRYAVTERKIERWLEQFAPIHRDVAARLLDVVDFVAPEQIDAAFRSLLARLNGWDKDERRRSGRWRFVPFSVSAGESGDTMLHAFRVANDLDYKKYNNLFIQKRDLLAEGLGASDNVVFVDDFAGTGDQAVRGWQQSIGELLPGRPKAYLVMPVVRQAARRRIAEETDFRVLAHKELHEGDELFNNACSHFSNTEKRALLRYCQRASPQTPRGYGECGLVLVFAHRCPNNTIPILHAAHRDWNGLFPR